MSSARYIVGIDLGTTNSVVVFAEADSAEEGPLTVLEVPQLINAGLVEARAVLPSFLYLAGEQELPGGSLDLPWAKHRDFAVGEFAQKRGAEVPGHLVSSAKSWLSFAAADRTAPILPWGGGEGVRRVSPIEASTLCLAHLRDAWKYVVAGRDESAHLEEQEILLTVPASFDPVARELTVRAAHEAGLVNLTLLEEPQAAVYAWIEAGGDAWREAVKVGDLILVCDVGGGTTDFSLIAVREERGELLLERVAVGDHILLGGDNMDLALAYGLRERLAGGGTRLDSWQFRALVQSCRSAKERLLCEDAEPGVAISLLGRGRKVVGGTLRVDVGAGDVERALLDGFFPACEIADGPRAQPRTGVQEMGLPYAADPAVTRHLAHFLTRHRHATGGGAGFAIPTALLFNGGVMRAAKLRARLLEVISGWLRGVGVAAPPRILSGADPERAVAHGAAYYGRARRGRGVRIRSGLSRSYYLGVEVAMPAVPGARAPIKALCVVPKGLEEGSEVELSAREFGLVVGEPTEFRFLGSATRNDDQVGDLIEEWGEDIEELPALDTILESRDQVGALVPVRLHVKVSEVGVLELWFVTRDGSQRWKLEFNVRGCGAAS
jgi:hypothetical protein